MHIVIVGGLDRAESQLERMAQQAGHSFELHTGHMGGRGSTNLESAIERAQLVIVVTDLNSHGAVQVARKTASRLGRSLLIVRKCSTARFSQVLAALPRTGGAHANVEASAACG
jgi:fructose-specific phosphotransferase system component IIB